MRGAGGIVPEERPSTSGMRAFSSGRTGTFSASEAHRLPAGAGCNSLKKFPKQRPETITWRRSLPRYLKISIDYAIMEKAEHVAMAEACFDWDDVGGWTALPAHLATDGSGNTFRGTVVTHAAQGNIAIATKRMIALCGVRDLIVVETEDAILVCHRDAGEQIKQLQPNLPEAVR